MPSSVIRDFVYDAEQQALAITFASGRAYVYYEVPPDVHDGLVTAGSRGAFFNAYIRDVFRCEEVTSSRRAD